MISRAGESAEVRFRASTGASPAKHARDGDALLDGVSIEVKRADGGALSQVRAMKYITVVALHFDTWYVVPAHEVVRIAARHSRGQHTENPFESCTMCISDIADFRIPSEGDLLKATREAIAQADRFTAIKLLMREIAADCRSLARGHRERVASALCQPPQDVMPRTFQARGLFD